MMWLGIVLHTGMIYMIPADPLSGSPDTTLVATILTSWIHIFRMPLFFMMAGFFVVLLVDRRGIMRTLQNRLLRIGVPFAIFWPVLMVLVNFILLAHAQKSGRDPLGISFDFDRWMINNTGHMWFLYYLVWFSLVLVPLQRLVAGLVSPGLKTSIKAGLSAVSQKPLGPVALAIPTFIFSLDHMMGLMAGDSSFAPGADSMAYYAVFYFYGMYLYAVRDQLIDLFTHQMLRNLLFGTLLFVGANALLITQMNLYGVEDPDPLLSLGTRICFALAAWIWSFFFLGLFLRFLSGESAFMRYMSDSSYWVYLTHYPLILFLAYIFYSVPLHPLAEMLIFIVITTVMCVLSYQMFARRSAIGRLLNGTGSR